MRESQGKKTDWTPEQLARIEEMKRICMEFIERRMRRVQVIQDLHC